MVSFRLLDDREPIVVESMDKIHSILRYCDVQIIIYVYNYIHILILTMHSLKTMEYIGRCYNLHKSTFNSMIEMKVHFSFSCKSIKK